jgi:hypothetical protein
MNYKGVAQAIDLYQRRPENRIRFTFNDINTRSTFLFPEGATRLPNNRAGLYWVWTTCEIDDLVMSRHNVPTVGERRVPISQLSRERRSEFEDITNGQKLTIDNRNYKLVYNGMGNGLMERIRQEVRIGINNTKTGSLDIAHSTINDPNNWLITFVDFTDPNFQNTLPDQIEYFPHASMFELIWRQEYGWPLLCRK